MTKYIEIDKAINIVSDYYMVDNDAERFLEDEMRENGTDLIDRVLEIIDEATVDYEAVPTEIDVGREKAVISFEKKDGMLAMASMIRVLVLGLKGERG